ncbi:uncharacterized protein LOC120358912 isoform X1 [Solenopsis invicta]|uniref:uncharacterized protein LOC120358912 isoform X1 n=1 Tax=Solenopsis invicta TaxID=13686 RepID=UPI00193D02E3|nr:uncharacterized protein LOC120358912 isoform X1 [Solenopsis invicta]
MQFSVANSNRNKENVPTDNTLNDNAVDEVNFIKLSQSTLKEILTEIKEIRKGQDEILQKINNLENKSKSSKDILQAVQKLNLPVQTVEQFQILIKDEKALSILERYFILLGGLNISNALDGFLKASVTDKLIKTSFTWKEGEQKIRFRETPLSLRYYGALRQIEQFKNTSIKEFEVEMAKVIKNAQQRHYMVQHRVMQVSSSALQRSKMEEELAANYASAAARNRQ